MGVSRAKSGYIPTLDGWRALAIAGVILSHSFASTYWTANGALGVNLFFAISGYLITTRLLGEERQTGAISLRQFYLRRAFRILPPALFYLGVMGLLTLGGVIASSGQDFLSCLLFLRNYWGADAHDGWYTGHFWSLAVEEQFYLFWPALLVVAGTVRSRWIAPVLAVAFSIWRSLDVRHGWIADLFHNEALRNHGLRSDYRMDSLLWGCTLALVAQRVDLSKFLSRRFAPVLALGSLVAIVALNVIQPQSYMVGESMLFPVVLIATVMQPATWLGRMLEGKAISWIGRLSYSLYLWQQPFVSQYHHGALQWFPLNVALAFGCAIFSFYVVEKPMLRLGHKLTSPKPTPVPMEKQKAMAAAR